MCRLTLVAIKELSDQVAGSLSCYKNSAVARDEPRPGPIFLSSYLLRFSMIARSLIARSCYSYRKLFTGFTVAARPAWYETVTSVIASATSPATPKIHQLRLA